MKDENCEFAQTVHECSTNIRMSVPLIRIFVTLCPCSAHSAVVMNLRHQTSEVLKTEEIKIVEGK